MVDQSAKSTMKLNPTNRIVLKSDDDQKFDVGYEIIRESKLLVDVFEYTFASTEPVLVGVKGIYLQLAISFLSLFESEPIYEPPINLCVRPPPPDDDKGITFWADIKNVDLVEMIKVAEYLNAPRLIDYICHLIWKRVRNDNVGHMASFFDVDKHLTPEEILKLQNISE